jgi:hypothetical protein
MNACDRLHQISVSGFAYNCGLRARQVTYVTLYTKDFGRLVASTTAPIATGRNESCRVGTASDWGIAPFHGAPQSWHTQSKLVTFQAPGKRGA